MTWSTTLQNPDVYLNHLPPNEANQFEVARNVYLVILGAVIWDVLVYIPVDFKIVYEGFGAVTICFILSRLFSVAYALLWVIESTHPVANCSAINISMGLVCMLAMACTSFIFLRRLHATYYQQRIVCWAFSFLWFGVSSMTITVPIGVKAQHIPGTGYCTLYEVESYTSVSEFLPAVFDTLVFFAISYRLITEYTDSVDSVKWSSFLTGRSLPMISRAMLRGGQQYYLIVFAMTIVSGVVLYTPSVPVTYRPMLTLAQTTLASSMACRVFRNMKMLDSTFESSTLPRVMSEIGFSPPAGHKSTAAVVGFQHHHMTDVAQSLN